MVMPRARSALELMIGQTPPGLPPLEGLEPLVFARQRLALVQHLQKVPGIQPKGAEGDPPAEVFPREALEQYFGSIRADIEQLPAGVWQAERLVAFDREVNLALEAAQTGAVTAKPDLDLPERQLLWAATLSYLNANGKLADGFHMNPVVEAVSGSRFVDSMTMDFCMQAGATEERGSAKVIMGPPGSWFYHYRDDRRNYINLDLVQSLLLGGVRDPKSGLISTNVDAVFAHEDGHNRLSLKWPESLRKVYDEMAVLLIRGGREDEVARLPDESPAVTAARAEGPAPEGLEPEAYKRLLMLEAQFDLTKLLWNSAEDICVNTYTVWNADSKRGGTHHTHLGDGINVVSTVATGHGVRVLEDLDGKEPEPIASARAALGNFSRFVNMSFFIDNNLAADTPEGWKSLGINLEAIENEGAASGIGLGELREVCHAIGQTQPMLMYNIFPKGKIPRIAIPSLTDRGATHELSTPEVLPLDELPLRYNLIRNEMIEELFEFAQPMIEKAMQEQERKVDEEIRKQQDRPDTGGEQSPDRGRAGGSGKGVNVKGMGTPARAPKLPGGDPQSDRDKENKERAGGDKGQQDQDDAAQNAKTAGKLRQERIDGRTPGQDGKDAAMGPADGGQAKATRLGPEGGMTSSAASGPGGFQVAREGLVLGDGEKVSLTAVTEGFQEAVEDIARSLRRIARQTQQYESTTSVDPSLVPVYSGSKMIKRQAFKRFVGDLARGQVNDDSRRIFNGRENRAVPVEGDIVIMVDGSGSMTGKPLEIAMKTSELMRQAAERANYRVFITMWGDDKDWSRMDPASNPYLIAEPGMDTFEVQQRMETVLEGLSSGTQLAPGFPNVLERISEARLKPGVLQGRTHFMVISDCGIADPAASKATMEAVLNGLPNATVDVVVSSGQEPCHYRSADYAIPRSVDRGIGLPLPHAPHPWQA